MKSKQTSASSRPPDPLDAAEEHLDRAEQAVKLAEYSDDYDEPTGRTEVTVNLQSHPDIEKPKSDPPQAKVAISFVRAVRGWPQALVALGVLALIGWYLWVKR